MKIIGETAEGFLLSATKTEVANLCGYYSQYNNANFKPGDELDIMKIYRSFYELSKSASYQINQSANAFRKILESLEAVQSGTITLFKESEKDFHVEK